MKYLLLAAGLLLSVGACKSGGSGPRPAPTVLDITGHWQTNMVYGMGTARGGPDFTMQLGGAV
jgi:hypothetical protein